MSSTSSASIASDEQHTAVPSLSLDEMASNANPPTMVSSGRHLLSPSDIGDHSHPSRFLGSMGNSRLSSSKSLEQSQLKEVRICHRHLSTHHPLGVKKEYDDLLGHLLPWTHDDDLQDERKNQNSFDFKRDKHKGRKDRSRNEIFENFLHGWEWLLHIQKADELFPILVADLEASPAGLFRINDHVHVDDAFL
nr:hypothetical protein Iba_chr12dCG9700 [Ipomoea batatas]